MKLRKKQSPITTSKKLTEQDKKRKPKIDQNNIEEEAARLFKLYK